MDLTGVGIWSHQLRYGDKAQSADAAAELEELGYRALWIPDVGRTPVLDSVVASATPHWSTRRSPDVIASRWLLPRRSWTPWTPWTPWTAQRSLSRLTPVCLRR